MVLIPASTSPPVFAGNSKCHPGNLCRSSVRPAPDIREDGEQALRQPGGIQMKPVFLLWPLGVKFCQFPFRSVVIGNWCGGLRSSKLPTDGGTHGDVVSGSFA